MGGAYQVAHRPAPPYGPPMAPNPDSAHIAVVIPCYRVRAHLAGVLERVGPWARTIVCVDDACPEDSGKVAEERAAIDERIVVVRRAQNGGVGAAMVSGYLEALDRGATVLVKVDGDGQMDPRLAPALVQPILDGEADYVKGNRFFSPQTVAGMPWVRLMGNAGLSFMSKLSSGYWDLFDPTNGFTALHGDVARALPLDRVHPRYFFESDLLFRLGVLRAKVVELPLAAVYGEEQSNLSVTNALLTFPWLHLRNLTKRIGYNYVLRNVSVGSLYLGVGAALTGFGIAFGALMWARGALAGDPATAGTVMLAALPVLLGFQFLVSFLNHDIASVPSEPLHPRLFRVQVLTARE